jgi:hypothetical protein
VEKVIFAVIGDTRKRIDEKEDDLQQEDVEVTTGQEEKAVHDLLLGFAAKQLSGFVQMVLLARPTSASPVKFDKAVEDHTSVVNWSQREPGNGWDAIRKACLHLP